MNPFLFLQGFLAYQKGRGLSEGTIVRLRCYLNKFFRWLGSSDIRDTTIETVKQYRNYLTKTPSSRTGKSVKEESIRQEVYALASFFEYLYLHEHIIANPLEGMKFVRTEQKNRKAIFSEEDMTRFLDSIPVTTDHELRDRTLFELMYSSGLRIGEAIDLEIKSVNLEDRVLFIRQGKGRKDRYVPFSTAAQKFLFLYLTTRRRTRLAGISMDRKKDYLFVGQGGRLCYLHIRKRFARQLETAGLSGKGYTIHSIRHATATHLLAHGADIRYVQELLGHEDLKTTQLYTRPEEDNIKAVYRTYHPRENEYYRELDNEYITAALELKERLEWGRERSKQYRREGQVRSMGRYKKQN